MPTCILLLLLHGQLTTNNHNFVEGFVVGNWFEDECNN